MEGMLVSMVLGEVLLGWVLHDTSHNDDMDELGEEVDVDEYTRKAAVFVCFCIIQGDGFGYSIIALGWI